MESLYDFLRKTYNSGIIELLGFTDGVVKLNKGEFLSFDNLINDKNWCLELIRTNLDYTSKDLKLNKAYAYRYRHIVICWLLGVGLSEYIIPNSKNDMIFHRTWQLCAYTHDYGYFCDETFMKPSKDFFIALGDYYLLKDNYKNEALKCLNGFLHRYPNLLSCSYDEIEEYYYNDIERRKDLIKKEKERSDHGIVGACLAFREYIRDLESRPVVVFGLKLDDGVRIKEINKTACLITAAHNLWGKRIKKECRLLSLMGLVDTIEATKCFYEEDSIGRYYSLINWHKLLELIKLSYSNGSLEIDITQFEQYAIYSKSSNAAKMKNALDKYICSLMALKDWTSFNTKRNGNIISIDFSKFCSNAD